MKGQKLKAPGTFDLPLSRSPYHIPPYHESCSPQYYQSRSHGIYSKITHIRAEALIGYDVDTCVAKSRNGIKDRYPHAPYAKLRNKDRHIQKCAHTFHHKGAKDHAFHKMLHSGQGVYIKDILHQKGLAKAHFFAKAYQYAVHDGNDTQSAGLYQYQYDDLTEKTEGGKYGNRHQSRNANRRSGCEKRIHKGHSPAVGGGYGKHQQQSPKGYAEGKTEHDLPGGGKPFLIFFLSGQ